MIKISGLKVPIDYTKYTLAKLASDKLKIDINNIIKIQILKQSLNNKNKCDLYFNMDIIVFVNIDEESINALKYDDQVSKELNYVYYLNNQKHLSLRPVVVGFGPAGMFAALILAQAGERPIILERGQDVEKRKDLVNKFFKTGVLDLDTNVQFGEGGAGTFSDGKLKIGAKDFRKIKILKEYIKAGAPKEILYLDKPHIGTDNLSKIVKNIREQIISLGGEVIFGAKFEKILKTNDNICGVGYLKNGTYNELQTNNLILAIGHSARDTYKLLLKDNIVLSQKPIAVGLRIEHPQSLINKIQYGNYKNQQLLGSASYKLVVHLKNGHGIYSFCMCPGGFVVPSTSENESIVTNGMSEFSRAGANANTALLVTISSADLKSDNPLAGVEFQRKLEHAAFIAGGENYRAPAIRLEDFLNHKNSNSFGEVIPTYSTGTNFSSPDDYLPNYVCDSLRNSIKEMDDWMPGYNFPDAVLTGVETRSSSPIQIKRDDKFEAIGIEGLYPCGEGAGYAGGIISSALDGVLCAETIIKKNNN